MSLTGGRTPATRSPIIANLGIHLKGEERQYVATARRPDGTHVPSERRVHLPRLPSALLESSCGMIRAFWRRHQRCVGVLLYLDIEVRAWDVFVPPQTVASNDLHAHCDFRGFHVPFERLRLAGSIRSWPSMADTAAELFVPPWDGMHLLVNPHLSWINLLGFMHVDGEIVPTPVEHLIADEHDALISTLTPRFQFADVL